MSTTSSSSNGGGEGEGRKRRPSETEFNGNGDTVPSSSATSASSSHLNANNGEEIQALDIPTNSTEDNVATLENDIQDETTVESTPVNINITDADVTEEAAAESADSTKPPPSIIQIDFFEENSESSSASIQFLSSASTLYGVVEALFEFFLEDRLQEAIYSHVWIIKMGRSSSYIGPFPESAFDGSQVSLGKSPILQIQCYMASLLHLFHYLLLVLTHKEKRGERKGEGGVRSEKIRYVFSNQFARKD